MGVNVRTEDLTYIDLTGYDSFSGVNDDPNGLGALDKFEETLVGKAQIAAIQEGAAQQALGQGVENYELSNSQVRRILFSEQASQSYGGGHDVTNEQMLDDHGPAWYEKLGGALTGLFASADEAVSDVVHSGVDATVDGVTNNDGMAGQAADALSNRQAQLDAEIEQQVNGTAPSTPGM